MFCRYCGTQTADDAVFCSKCGRRLDGVQNVVAVDGMNILIPPNRAALLAYYLGVFSLCFFPLSIPAIIFGIKGISYADEHPGVHGKAHSWTGIIIGSIVLFAVCAIIFILAC